MIRSAWLGLWKNDDKHFAVSERIDVEAIKGFSSQGKVRVVLKRNKFYQKGTNRPLYCIAFADGYGASSNEITSRELQYNDKFDHAELKDLFQTLFDEYDGDLSDLIEELAEDKDRRENMRAAARSLAVSDTLNRIADAVMGVIRSQN